MMGKPLIISSLILMLFSINSLIAQTEDSLSKERSFWSKPEKHNLTFRLDYSLNELFSNHSFSYTGEKAGSNSEEYLWIDIDSSLIDFNQIDNDVNLKFDLTISTVEPLNIGLTYHVLSYKLNSIDRFSATYLVFLGLGATADYRIPIRRVKGLYVNPGVSLGYYISDENWTGKGRESYLNLKVAALYSLWDKLDVRLYTDYSRWKYKESSESVIFTSMDRKVNADLNHLNLGLGLAYRFHLIPD